jgi:dolichol-phosphate mannosyltransferase
VDLSIVVPTLDEADNIAPLVSSLDAALPGLDWEVIFVDDDSRDGTQQKVLELARSNPRVRLLRRIGRLGLASACIEGLQSSTAAMLAVMDADAQHDETLLPQMLQILKDEPIDLVIGSRYISGGESTGGFDASRQRLSRIGTQLGRRLLPYEVSDPLSGFFMMRREVFEAAVRKLSGIGFKILLDILTSAPTGLRVRELPYRFRNRQHGTSKLDAGVGWSYLLLLADKHVGHLVPLRFILFCAVGALGLLSHLLILGTLLGLAAVPFKWAQASATFGAMVGNFTLNNLTTFRDRRLRGMAFIKGLLSFCLICGAGAFANVGIASLLFDTRQSSWWLAGIAGAAISSVWNYAVSSIVTWRNR